MAQLTAAAAATSPHRFLLHFLRAFFCSSSSPDGQVTQLLSGKSLLLICLLGRRNYDYLLAGMRASLNRSKGVFAFFQTLPEIRESQRNRDFV
jgi:hypothetical protein